LLLNILLWIIVIIILLGILGKEILRYQEAKRDGEDPDRNKKRFRRRVKGVAILMLIFLTIQLGEYIEPHLTKREILIFYLNCFIELIWLLILVAREFTDISNSYLSLRSEVTIDTLKQIQEEVAANRSPDDQPIPGPDFDENDKPES